MTRPKTFQPPSLQFAVGDKTTKPQIHKCWVASVHDRNGSLSCYVLLSSEIHVKMKE